MELLRVYLAGQPNQYCCNWKQDFKKLDGFDFYDWEIDSDQTSPETFFPDDLKAVKTAQIMIAHPGTAPSESTWIEIGYFLANNTIHPGDTCPHLIIIWTDDRLPRWSVPFVNKAGILVNTVSQAITELQKLKHPNIQDAIMDKST